MNVSDASLRITEIFCSLQGESSWLGERTVFVRLTGCPLRCVYCDSAYAFQGGEQKKISDIISQVRDYTVDYVCVTGGEPLAQPACIALLSALCDQGYKVSLETSGAVDIAAVDPRVKRIVDLKTPSSQEMHKNLYSNLALITANDEIKFVIGDRKDYDWAVEMVEQYDLVSKAGVVLFSPVAAIEGGELDGLPPRELADWIVSENPGVRMQLQLHKLLWGDVPGV